MKNVCKIKLPNGTVKTFYNRDVNELRQFVANEVAQIIGNRVIEDGIPYCPNEGDTSYWTVDSGNNWKIKFDEQEISTFELIFRYGNSKLINSLGFWIAYKLGGELIEEIS